MFDAIPLPSQASLNDAFIYDGDAGVLIHKKRPVSAFKNARGCNTFNSRFAGNVAGALSGNYITVTYMYQRYSAHRVIWKMVNGIDPIGEIDHIDHDGTNNRIENLRDVSRRANSKNLPLNKNNKSGHNGVSWCRKTQSWFSCITVNGKAVNLGRYKELSNAVDAREEANSRYKFAPSHGRKNAIA